MSAHTLRTRRDFPPATYIAAVLNQALAALIDWLTALVRAIVGPEFVDTGREPFAYHAALWLYSQHRVDADRLRANADLRDAEMSALRAGGR